MVEDVEIENATITLKKEDEVNAVFRCEAFDDSSFSCLNWEKTNIPFVDNGDSITFTVTEFSAYGGGFIEITKAMHLDENRSFISDIFEEVKILDGIWSETIPEDHFVRVTFERNLSSFNDITIYPRTISGTPGINIYEEAGTEVIASFPTITDNENNKVYLTGLNGIQDTFDLQILNGSVEFDHIIDPFPNATFQRCRKCFLW